MRSRWLLLACAAMGATGSSGAVHHGGVHYGPKGCVSLAQSARGTCVLTTQCADIDTTAFEFAFLCVDDKGTEVKHTFGEGGFLSEEEYDTEVKCTECVPPEGTEVAAEPPAEPAKPAEKQHSTKVLVAAEPAEEDSKAPPATLAASHALLTKFAASKQSDSPSGVPPAHAAFYGPGGCVAAFRSAQGTCVMQTRCGGQNLTGYEFGVGCVDSEGDTTQHLFGKNSFDPEETFDTLVECQKCVGKDATESPSQLHALSSSVKTLQEEMKEVAQDMEAIKAKLNPPADTEAAPTDDSDTSDDDDAAEATDDEGADAAEEQAAASEGEDAAAAEAAEEPPQGFLRHARRHKQVRKARSPARHVHHHERRARKHHRVRVEPEEDEILAQLGSADDTDFSAPEVTDY